MKKLYFSLLLAAAAFPALRAQETSGGGEESVSVTYTYTLDGQVIGSRVVSETAGEAPADRNALPRFVNATGYPETIGTGTTSYTIATSYDYDVMPFRPSTEEKAYWYFVNFNVSGSGIFYWYSGETQGKEKTNLNGATGDELDNYVFCMAGDWLNGFTIQGKNGKYVTAPNANPQDFAVATLPTQADQALSVFLFEEHPAGGEMRFRLKGTNTWLAHTSSSSLNLTFYSQRPDTYNGTYVYFTYAGIDPETVDITYTYLLNGQEIGSRTVTETVGAAPADAVPVFVLTAGYPQLITDDTTAHTIETAYNNKLPFTPSTDEESFYYFIRFFVSNKNYYWYSAETTGREQYNLDACSPAESRHYVYRMAGDWLNGFTIQGLNGKYLTAPNASPHDVNCVFADTPDPSLSYFLLEKHPTSDNLRFRLKGVDTWLAHTSHDKRNLSFYNQYTYVGSHVFFESFDTNYNETYLNSLQTQITQNRVGYPAATHETAVALQAAIEDATAYPKFAAVRTALNNYWSAREVVMPEDGKAYHLHNIQQAGDGYLLAGSEKGLVVKNYEAANLDADATFVCHALENGQYIFVSATKGDYVCWRGHQGGYNGNTGLTAEYAGPQCSFTLTSYGETAAPGTFSLLAKRNDGTTGTFILAANGSFNAWGDTKCWQSGYSNLFRLEEADYTYNNVTLQTPANDSGANAGQWATLYLPYAVTIPEGVEAYTAWLKDNYLMLELVEGNTLARGEAVVLHSDNNSYGHFVPSTESPEKDENNVLLGTVSTDEATPAGVTYALSGAFQNGVGFYPYRAATLPAGKAYYVATNASAPALLFAIGGTTTGIGTATAAPAAESAIYDLSGRRVDAAGKGIYITGGKKVFVK